MALSDPLRTVWRLIRLALLAVLFVPAFVWAEALVWVLDGVTDRDVSGAFHGDTTLRERFRRDWRHAREAWT